MSSAEKKNSSTHSSQSKNKNNEETFAWQKSKSYLQHLHNMKRLHEIEKDSHEILSRREKKEPMLIMRYAHLGMEFIFVFGIIFYIGYYVDSRWGFSPWFTLLSAFAGFAAAMIRLVNAAREISRSIEESDKEE